MKEVRADTITETALINQRIDKEVAAHLSFAAEEDSLYAKLNPDTDPHFRALASIAIIDLGCGNSLNSFLYAFIALILNANSLLISTKVFGVKLTGKYHSVEDKTSNEKT